MSYSQEIYDAVRSRISGGNVSDAVQRVAYEMLDISPVRQLAEETVCSIGNAWTRPSALYRPEVSLDGGQYCVLYGQDLMSGCAGFGKTMHEAMSDFDRNWGRQQAPPHPTQGTNHD